jgi:hypothetical protein
MLGVVTLSVVMPNAMAPVERHRQDVDCENKRRRRADLQKISEVFRSNGNVVKNFLFQVLRFKVFNKTLPGPVL